MLGGKVYLDADSVPKLVFDFVDSYCKKNKTPLITVANSTKDAAVHVSKTLDAADDYIYDKSEPKDLVITRDMHFAKRLISKGVTVINDRGLEFTAANIDSIIKEADFNKELSRLGLVRKINRYNKKQLADFEKTFIKILVHK